METLRRLSELHFVTGEARAHGYEVLHARPQGKSRTANKGLGTSPSRTHKPCALAAAGAVQPLAGGEHRSAAPRPACDISSGRSTGGLGKEASRRATERGWRFGGPWPRSCLFLAGMGAGVARAVTRTGSASWACFRFAWGLARPAHRRLAGRAAQVAAKEGRGTGAFHL